MANDVAIFFLYKMYWTPAKMLLLTDVNEYSFAKAVNSLPLMDDQPKRNAAMLQCVKPLPEQMTTSSEL